MTASDQPTDAPLKTAEDLDALLSKLKPWADPVVDEVRLSESPDILDHFPFETIRPAQRDILDAFMRGHARGTKNIIFEAPTGIGKSALAFTMSSWAAVNLPPAVSEYTVDGNFNPESTYAHGAYLLTTQKTLQDQYMGDFADKGMVELRGVANYLCEPHKTDCGQGRQLDIALKNTGEKCPPDDCYGCPYVQARDVFKSSPVSLTNFAYFLTVSSKTNLFKPRPLLILDEAHNTEMQILNLQSIEVSSRRLMDLDILSHPSARPGDPEDFKRVVEWCRGVLMPALEDKIKSLRLSLKSGGMDARRAAGRLEGYIQLLDKVRDFAGDEGMPSMLDWLVFSDDNHNLSVKPLDAAPYAKGLFSMGKQVVFMSATILDAVIFAKSLGLDRDDCGFKRLESEFPVDNRLIHFRPAGSMSYRNKDRTLPFFLKSLGHVCAENDAQKGLIHCQSFDLARKIMDFFDGTPIGKRLITHDSGVRGAREEAIRRHTESPEPTILLSPSMTEGLDLKDDLSRWQVISKVPYPSLGDPFVRAKKEREEKWYAWMTALALTQATGRSVRSAKDYASTYVLDSDFDGFMARSGQMFPKWWKDAIRYER